MPLNTFCTLIFRLSLLFLLLIAGASTQAEATNSQDIQRVHAAETVVADQPINVFVELSGRQSFEGLDVQLPDGWRLLEAHAARDAGSEPVEFQIVQPTGPIASVRTDQPLRGRLTIVLKMLPGLEAGEATIQVARWSEARGSGYAESLSVRVLDPTISRNPAYRVVSGTPVQLHRNTIPGLGAQDPVTLEFWIKTTGLREVILSTWDGDDTQAYPVEIMTDAQGHLRVYRGYPGYHEGLVSPRPVSDGTWHHVAYVVDPDEGWMRLILNGFAVDSLRLSPIEIENTLPLAFGGRSVEAHTDAGPLYTGLLDEFRMWPEARSVALIRWYLRAELPSPPMGAIRLGFEEPIPDYILFGSYVAEAIADEDLQFRSPIEQFVADPVNGIVELSWRSGDNTSIGYQLERSVDGHNFDVIAIVDADQAVVQLADGTRVFQTVDYPPASPVVFYRVRRIVEIGEGHVTASIKLGLGSTNGEERILAIHGNSPNPFRERTMLTVEVPESGHVQITIWDVTGSRVAVIFEGELQEGRHEIPIVLDQVPNGVYFARLQTAIGVAAHRMTVAR